MSILLFVFIHIIIGLALIFFYGKLPRAGTTFTFVFLAMSLSILGSSFIQFVSALTCSSAKRILGILSEIF